VGVSQPPLPPAESEDAASVPDLLDLPPDALYSARLPMAMAYAAVMHSPQRRKDDLGTPYITHPMAVASLVWHYGLGVPAYEPEIEDLVIAALLHDVPEDAGGDNRLREIGAMFGPRVAAVVYSATDSLATDPDRKEPWRPRKEQHIARVERLAAPTAGGAPTDAGACLVIAGDKMHNLSGTAAAVASSGDSYLERFSGGIAGTRWYYRTMFEALRPALPDAMITDFSVRLATLGA
jgi:(p)ppGpp synthase/HD superfamily hydrolase